MLAIPHKIWNDLDKYIHYTITHNLVFEINRMNKPVMYTNIFKFDSCADLYINISKSIIKNNNISKIIPIDENNNINSLIYDIFAMDENENLLSIPYNEEITIQDFIESNQYFFKNLYIKPIRSIFKIYIIDNSDLVKLKKD